MAYSPGTGCERERDFDPTIRRGKAFQPSHKKKQPAGCRGAKGNDSRWQVSVRASTNYPE